MLEYGKPCKIEADVRIEIVSFSANYKSKAEVEFLVYLNGKYKTREKRVGTFVKIIDDSLDEILCVYKFTYCGVQYPFEVKLLKIV